MQSSRIHLLMFSLAIIIFSLLLLLSTDGYTEGEGNGVSQSNHQSTLTSPDGSSVTRSTNRVWDPETQTWKTGVTTTDQDGKTVTRYTETQKTDDGYVRNSAVAGPDGKAAVRTGKGTWDPETKTWKREAVQVGPEGEAVYSGTEVKKNEDGYTRNSAVSDSEGNTATRSATGTKDPEKKTWKKSVTKKGRKGKIFNRQSEYSGQGAAENQ